LNAAARILTFFGRIYYTLVDTFASFLRQLVVIGELTASTARRMPLVLRNVGISIGQMYAIGITSLPLVTVIALFVGSVTVTQAVYQFSGFIPLRYLGLAVCKTMITELAPVITSLVVSGRITTAIAAEIGSMKTTEQLDAMNILSLDPIRYLVVPKTLACVVMMPVLVIWADLMAFLGSIVTVVLTVRVTLATYLAGLRMFFNPIDLYMGIFKTSVFGAIIAIVGSHFGYQAKGGAEGVGTATTRAVMLSSVLILIFDFIMAFMFLR
jgi:phospholipid/cholesterol/gamma-HCH transport system permease protein